MSHLQINFGSKTITMQEEKPHSLNNLCTLTPLDYCSDCSDVDVGHGFISASDVMKSPSVHSAELHRAGSSSSAATKAPDSQ